IYSGHGFVGGWANMNNNNEHFYSSDFLNSLNIIYPFTIAFACKTGFFIDNNNIGRYNVTANNKGCVAYFGSSVVTLTNTDKRIEKKIFSAGSLNMQYISVITTTGMKKYEKNFWSWLAPTKTHRYLKSYNLLGDPSLNVFGIGEQENYIFENDELFVYGIKITYKAIDLIKNEQNFIVKSGANIELKSGGTIVLNSGFKVE
ncbi:MAG: C25 family cysteine peptidase, partial [Bacteroidales bacterium]|nr:C25 family cysteine peptidase [Bacteroidales bacterium]